MKITIKNVFTEDNLISQSKIASRGKRYHTKIIKFHEDKLYRLNNLRNKILSGTYFPGKDNTFIIYEPKMRVIRSNDFYSKIVQGILVNYVIIPCIEKTLIYDNYASRKQFGTKKAIDQLIKFIRSAFINYGNSRSKIFVLRCDIRKYFDNISIEILFKMIDSLNIDTKLKNLIKLETRAAFPNENRGLCLGHELAQWFSIWYLNGMDHFIKEELHIKYYGRYMDDFYLISDSYEYLEYCMHEIEKYLKNLNLELNLSKTYIKSFDDNRNFTFLGFEFQITNSGKVKMILDKKSVTRMKKRINTFKKQLTENKIDESNEYDFIISCIESLSSWKSHAVQGTNPDIIYHIDQYFYNSFYTYLQKYQIDYKNYCYIHGMYEYTIDEFGRKLPKKLNGYDKLWVQKLFSLPPMSYDDALYIRKFELV